MRDLKQHHVKHFRLNAALRLVLVGQEGKKRQMQHEDKPEIRDNLNKTSSAPSSDMINNFDLCLRLRNS